MRRKNEDAGAERHLHLLFCEKGGGKIDTRKRITIRLPQDVLGARFIAGEWGSVSPGSLEDKLTAQNVLIVEEGTSRFFDPKKDYLYPIPSNDIAQSRGNVEQNPNWK